MRDSITLRHKFSAAHRLTLHRGKCSKLHGHNYVADITVSLVKADTTRFNQMTIKDLGPNGMVCDFALVKEVLGGWINDNWDHATILNSQDPMLWVNESLTDPGTPLDPEVLLRRYGHRPFVMVGEPTAENMARYLLAGMWFHPYPNLRDRVRVTRVEVWETDTCSATCEE